MVVVVVGDESSSDEHADATTTTAITATARSLLIAPPPKSSIPSIGSVSLSPFTDPTGPSPYAGPVTEPLAITTTLEPRGPAGAIILTDEQVADIGGGPKVFPVTVTVNGVDLPLRLARMGGENMIGFSKAVRAQAGVDIGDEIQVTITVDAAPRTVEVPDDLAAALRANPAAQTAFDALAYSHRKKHVQWVTDAKKEATRANRIAKTIENLQPGLPGVGSGRSDRD